MVATPVFLGATRSPTKAFRQGVGGTGRMSAEAFLEFIRVEGPLTALIQRTTAP